MSDFEMRSGFCVIALRRIEADHDVGEGALGLNELEAVALAQLQLEADLFGRVAAQRAVSLQLPLDPQVFLGLQVTLTSKQSRMVRVWYPSSPSTMM